MAPFADLTCDAFLGGRLRLWQPRAGYRAGIDPVLLAAAVPARAGQSVLDLGCGAGAAVFALGARVPDLVMCGVETQPGYADLARRNSAENNLPLEVVEADLSALPAGLRQRGFDHVIANPPYFDPARRSPARDAGREVALAGATPLATWIGVAARRLVPRGYLHVIVRTERLPELMQASGALGSLEVLPLAARAGRAPDLVILRARKGGRAAFRLHAPMVLHAGAAHQRDGEDYAPSIGAVLRAARPLDWPGARSKGG